MASRDDILKKYGARIESQFKNGGQQGTPASYSAEYEQFVNEDIPETSRYARWANTLGNLIKINVSEKDRVKLQKHLSAGHINVTPSQAVTLALVAFLVTFFGTALITVAFYLINESIQFLFMFLGFMASVFVFYYTYSMPARLAKMWRLKASSQMVPAILYIVVYMKHTSNLERAIGFAADHLDAPLGMDFKRIFYEVQVGKYASIKESLDKYLESWQDDAPEFVEAMHLIESSLLEPSGPRRIQTLEKSLQVILDGVYEKMLEFSRSIRSPLTNLYMLGIILPTLGLALLPLASTLLNGALAWYHVFVIFNLLIPFIVFYMTSEVLLKRPGGHGESEAIEQNPDYWRFTSKTPWIMATIIALPFIIIGTLPFLLQIEFVTQTLGLQSDYTFAEIGLTQFAPETQIFNFREVSANKTVGPFGPIAVLLSLFIPLGVGLFFTVAYSQKTKVLIKSRNQTKTLEQEFANSLFQLGSRLGDGTPAEAAFSKVAQTTKGQKTNEFFSLVNHNITNMGMSVEDAVFNPDRGAILYYPSGLIATSMRILTESAKKGLKVASRSLMSISEYVRNIHKITNRLRDLLAEVVSDMKSNMTFLAPLLAGIVVGLGAMITMIIGQLETLVALNGGNTDLGGFGSLTDITSLFSLNDMIPPYFLQIAVGLYIVQIIFILTKALVTVDAGPDPLNEKYQLAKNLVRGTVLYVFTALISIAALSILAIIALQGIGG